MPDNKPRPHPVCGHYKQLRTNPSLGFRIWCRICRQSIFHRIGIQDGYDDARREGSNA